MSISPNLPQAPNSQKRPASATVFAVLNLVFGVMGACGLIALFGMLLFTDTLVNSEIGKEMEKADPTVFEQLQDPSVQVTNMITGGIGLVSTILLFAGGMGLLAIRPYGRTATIYYAVLALLNLVFQIVVHFMVTIPLLDKMLAQGAAQGVDAQQLEAQVTMQKFSPIFGLIIGAIYPVFCLIFMNRKPILERYKPGYMADQDFNSPQQQTLPSNYTPPDQSNPYSSPFDPKQ